MKTYTDLRVEIEDVTVSAGIGLEPSMAQVVKALKRIVPPDVIAPNGQEVAPSSTSSPALQPWDKLRYIWRGSIRVAACNLGIALAAGPFACPTAHDPHLYLHTQSTAIFWTAGHVDVNATGVTAVGRSHAPDASPGDPLLALPLVALPLLKLDLGVKWAMPGDFTTLGGRAGRPSGGSSGGSCGSWAHMAAGSRAASLDGHFAAGSGRLQLTATPRAYLGEL
ncbi:Fmp27_GFWDK domain-containing protein, partial [Haematococcus lacustris]